MRGAIIIRRGDGVRGAIIITRGEGVRGAIIITPAVSGGDGPPLGIPLMGGVPSPIPGGHLTIGAGLGGVIPRYTGAASLTSLPLGRVSGALLLGSANMARPLPKVGVLDRPRAALPMGRKAVALTCVFK